MARKLLLRTIAFTLMAVMAATLGDILLSKAMKSVGEVEIDGLASVWHTGVRVFTSPAVWLAISLLFTHFLLWLAVLRWAELSVAIPLTATNYIFNAVLAGPMLNEAVGPGRWVGTFLVVVGVVLVSLSADTAPEPLAPAPAPPPPREWETVMTRGGAEPG
ncbi:MAG: EamA family transporter [Candidatus Eremiobacterota bacterium]